MLIRNHDEIGLCLYGVLVKWDNISLAKKSYEFDSHILHRIIMNKSNKKKNDQLGIPHGTAQNRLRKSILFDCLRKLQEDVCYQCGKKIDSVDELSIEHKQAWLDSENPVDLFFDLNNIGFSHLSCNIKAKRNTRTRKHGTHSNYCHNGCRCKECKDAHSKVNKRYRKYVTR